MQQLSDSQYVESYPIILMVYCVGVPPLSALQHVQLVSSPQNGSKAGDNLTATVDNATTGCASSSQTDFNKELPMGYVGGICVGEGLLPVPERLAARIRRGEFIEMCELISEYWLAKEEDGTPKADRQRPRRSWIYSLGCNPLLYM